MDEDVSDDVGGGGGRDRGGHERGGCGGGSGEYKNGIDISDVTR